MNNYAEQNRQLLRRYTPEQCILFELPDHIFAALQASKPLTWLDYWQGTHKCSTAECFSGFLFETPEGSMSGETNYYKFDTLSRQAEAEPTMLMLYIGPQKHWIL